APLPTRRRTSRPRTTSWGTEYPTCRACTGSGSATNGCGPSRTMCGTGCSPRRLPSPCRLTRPTKRSSMRAGTPGGTLPGEGPAGVCGPLRRRGDGRAAYQDGASTMSTPVPVGTVREALRRFLASWERYQALRPHGVDAEAVAQVSENLATLHFTLEKCGL